MMSETPEVSVVMSVYNGASRLRETINSILAQQEVSFEFIIINDGSTDETQEILTAYASRDPRIRVFKQKNRGLTQALIAGCAAAVGDYIARQDAGDVSLPNRLSRQVAVLKAHTNAIMVSCGTEFVGPEDEQLYRISFDDEMLAAGLAQLTLRTVRGPSHHGSTMFRRCAYEEVGGYRAFFYVAQDLDLWLRFSERGECLSVTEVDYLARLEVGAISSKRRSQQLKTTQVILECAKERRQGRSEQPVLNRWIARGAWQAFRKNEPKLKRVEIARFYYFIGCNLRRSRPELARHYFLRAIGAWPPHARAWIRLLRLVLSR
jgi:glycosyltransferase involved in cell wall biosynthesis